MWISNINCASLWTSGVILNFWKKKSSEYFNFLFLITSLTSPVYFAADYFIKPKGANFMRREQNDRANVKWAHPELADCWGVSSFEIVDKLTDTSISVEDRLEFRKTTEVPNAAREQLLASRPDLSAHARWLEYTVPGCPEEPNTPAHVTVRMPSDKSGGSLPVIFWVNGGALLMCDPKAFPLEELSLRHNAIVVATIYRTALEGNILRQSTTCTRPINGL
jgi:hypothetical protein